MFFTEDETKLVSGYPNKEEDQDTYEALMTPERKEIEFWLSVNQTPPFVDACGIDWDGLVEKYKQDTADEENELFKKENEKYLLALAEMSDKEVEEFETEYKLPPSIASIVTLGSDMHLYFKKIPNKTPSTGGFVFDDIAKAEVEKYEG